MVAITLVAGAAVFGFVNGQAGVSENQYGQSVANNVDYLREHFVVVSVQFYYTGSPPLFQSSACTKIQGQSGNGYYCNEMTISVYNNGAVGLTINEITLSNLSAYGAQGKSGPVVPKLSIISTASASSSSFVCGSYSGSGPVFTSSQTQPIAEDSVPPTVFTIVLPSYCSTLLATSGILDGASYQVQALGLYGNVVATQVTASG